ncbi:MAG: type I-C CRISPR-associated endonuclease Cas1 [Candidatus Dadabacteria bacterium]|nr:MAG: type I-C CRISPR-associated endonuclease Cas1 [Candidatus Dadabacteria bacterium]
MKRHLNTLYITTQGAWLNKDGETIAVNVDGQARHRIPMHLLQGLVCFGNVSISPFLLGACVERGIGISYLTRNGRFLARVSGPVTGNVLLRRAQYRMADDETRRTALAKTFVLGKLVNTRTALRRASRDNPERAANLQDAANRINGLLRRARTAGTLDEARGIEGEAARIYFSVFNELLLADGFTFSRRTRRPPLDAVNALLSFVYTLLVHDVRSALETVGLDPQVGFLHHDRPGRPSLALDVMEELRPVLADRLVLSLINRRQIRPNGFEQRESGAVWMDDETRKTVLTAWQERKQQELLHPFLDDRCTVGAVPHIQALLLARHLRGDLDGYPPFVWK